MNYDHNNKFGLLKFHSGYGKFYLNSPKGYTRKIINAQTAWDSKSGPQVPHSDASTAGPPRQPMLINVVKLYMYNCFNVSNGKNESAGQNFSTN